MQTLKTYTKDTLILLTLSQITEINNEFCEALKTKITKRFPTKPKAIQKALTNQALYTEQQRMESQKTSEKKPSKKSNSTVKKFELDTMLELGDTPTREGTVMGLVVDLAKDSPAKAGDIIEYIVNNFEQKRGKSEVNDGFARGYVSGALRGGHLKVVK